MVEFLEAAFPVIPVVTLADGDDPLGLVDCLASAGIETVEITLRSQAGYGAIETIRKARPAITVGVGTVLHHGQMKRAVEAGAQFVVSPGFDSDLLAVAGQLKVPYLPGVATVSEMMKVRKARLQCAKLFPAASVGGVDLLKAVASVLPELKFCPTGGIGTQNYQAYLALDNVLCVGGSWICPQEAISKGMWSQIRKLSAGVSGVDPS